MGPTSEMVFAASPKVVRKLSSLIGVRAKPTMAYRDPRALWVARSYIAGMTLRFARSPDAPKRTTVQGSATPPYTEPERPVSPAIVSPFITFRPVLAKKGSPKTYLHAIFSKLRAQLFRVLVVNRIHPQAPRAFQVQRPVVDEETLFRRALCDLQRHAKDRFFGLSRPNVT